MCVCVLCLRITLVCNEVYLRQHHVLMDSQHWDVLQLNWLREKLMSKIHIKVLILSHIITYIKPSICVYIYTHLCKYQSRNISFLKHGLCGWVLAVVSIFWFIGWRKRKRALQKSLSEKPWPVCNKPHINEKWTLNAVSSSAQICAPEMFSCVSIHNLLHPVTISTEMHPSLQALLAMYSSVGYQ